jgi:hypothetical protein
MDIGEHGRRFISREPFTGQPLLAKLLDGVVAALRDLVIGFHIE